jgi:DeoR family transcriptional regulator of aga operon
MPRSLPFALPVITPVKNLDMVISDCSAPADTVEALRAAGVQVVLV